MFDPNLILELENYFNVTELKIICKVGQLIILIKSTTA